MSTAPPLLPEITPEMAPFFAAARRHELVAQRCRGCGTYRLPARDLCSRCLSREASWERVSGRGTVFGVTVMHQSYHPAYTTPYAVVVVELEEGARLISNVVGCAPDEVRVGMPVEVVFEELSAEVTLPKFRPLR
jgi:hypothetical protein